MVPSPLALAACALALLSISCDGPKRKPTYPTEGKLLIHGQPVGGVTVFLHSADPAEAEPTRPVATTAADGTFSLTTTAANDGAPAGEYIVTILYEPLDSPLTRSKTKPPAFDKKYTDPKTSPLRARVESKAKNTLDPLDVK